MCVDLLLDLVGLVGHEDTAVRVAGAHLGLGTLESREEFGVDEGGFLVLQLLGDIPSETEVWILVDCTWDQTEDVADRTEDMREAV